MRRVLFLPAVLLGVVALAPAARGQASVPYRRPVERPAGSYVIISSSLSSRQSSPVSGRPSTSLGLQTSVSVPDGGEALVGSYSTARAGRNEFGAPVLGNVPILNRGLNHVGSSKSVRKTSASVRVRIIRMAEEEERQTGVRP